MPTSDNRSGPPFDATDVARWAEGDMTNHAERAAFERELATNPALQLALQVISPEPAEVPTTDDSEALRAALTQRLNGHRRARLFGIEWSGKPAAGAKRVGQVHGPDGAFSVELRPEPNGRLALISENLRGRTLLNVTIVDLGLTDVTRPGPKTAPLNVHWTDATLDRHDKAKVHVSRTEGNLAGLGTRPRAADLVGVEPLRAACAGASDAPTFSLTYDCCDGETAKVRSASPEGREVDLAVAELFFPDDETDRTGVRVKRGIVLERNPYDAEEFVADLPLELPDDAISKRPVVTVRAATVADLHCFDSAAMTKTLALAEPACLPLTPSPEGWTSETLEGDLELLDDASLSCVLVVVME